MTDWRRHLPTARLVVELYPGVCPVTVCIGATCEGGRAAVVAADRMVTFGPPMMLTTEPPELSKIQQLTDRAVLLFAGSVPDGSAILASSRARIGGQVKPPLAAIAAAAKAAYVELKRQRVEENILAPLLGADFPQFQALLAQSSASQMLQQILGLIMQHNLQLDVMVAGLDDDQAHLFVASHPGQLFPMDATGFAAIGSGALHAAVRLSLGQHTAKANLADAVYNVYEAKRAAEVAPGVGKATDMAILRNGSIMLVPEKVFQVLEEVHKERPSPSADETKKLREACSECFGGADDGKA
jgi:20S proteasome alpha/beta subunit